LVDDQLGGGVDVVGDRVRTDELVEVLAKAGVGEFGSKVLLGQRCCVVVWSVRAEAFDDVGWWNR
jgi:hypothetical protein